MIDYEKLEQYDKEKTKVLKYVLYKKRTEQEVRQKFQKEISEEDLENIIDELKEQNYISDQDYIKRAVNEFIALKNLSLKQIKYKLSYKGISSYIIEDYFANNSEELKEYEIHSIVNIINKSQDVPANEIIAKLLKKGFEYDNVKEALERGEI